MNYQKTNKAGTILLTAGITIIICTLFFIFFGTRLLINTDYLSASSVTQENSATDNAQQQTTTQAQTTAPQTSSAATTSSAKATTKASQSTTAKMQEEQTEKKTTAKDAKITVPGLTQMKIKSGSKSADVDLYNPGKNNCYFKISILLSDGTVLYKSDYVRPGQHIYEIELKKALKKGKYEATLHYDTYSTDGSYTEYNGADVPFTLIAE